jgi:alkylated DNA repair dioxygenase AlkB
MSNLETEIRKAFELEGLLLNGPFLLERQKGLGARLAAILTVIDRYQESEQADALQLSPSHPTDSAAPNQWDPQKYRRRPLDGRHAVFTGCVPEDLMLDAGGFEHMWAMHPADRPKVRVRGRGLVPIPRWQAAYGKDYGFAGIVLKSQPAPPELQRFLDWGRKEIDGRLNGILMNWYEGPEHYIGPHNDADDDLIEGSPIVTISYGENRKFRMRPNDGPGFIDFPAPPGEFFLIPYETNKSWKHEVPKSSKYRGRRLSVTMRAFQETRR